ncbi:uncharacterized protein LOC144430707 [Styela clava]
MKKVKRSKQKRKASGRIEGKLINLNAKNCDVNIGDERMVAQTISKGRSKIKSKQKDSTYHVGDRASTSILPHDNDVTTEESGDDTTQDEETQSEDEDFSQDEEQESKRPMASKRKSVEVESVSSKKKTKYQSTKRRLAAKQIIPRIIGEQDFAEEESERETEQKDKAQNEDFPGTSERHEESDSVDQKMPVAEEADIIGEYDHTNEYVDNKSTNDSGIETQEFGEQESDGQSTNDTENPSFYDEDTKVKEVASSSTVDSTIRNMKRRKTEVDRDKVQDRKIIKTEADNAGLGVFALFNVAERAEISIKANKFGEAIAELQQSENNDFRTKFLLSESMLRMGSTNTGTVVKELAEIVKSDSSDITEKYLLDLGIFMLNNGKIAKAMVLFACTAFISNNVFQIGMCIYRLSEAIRKIPISKAKKKIAQSPLQNKFGLWSESFDRLDDLMNSMLNHMEIIGGAKLQKSQAFALNWMSVATYFIGHDFLSKAKEYSKKGLDISLKLGVGYHVERTRSDLYSNYGQAICTLGNKSSGIEHIKKSLKIAEGVKDCPDDKKSDFNDNIKHKQEQLEYWKKRL